MSPGNDFLFNAHTISTITNGKGRQSLMMKRRGSYLTSSIDSSLAPSSSKVSKIEQQKSKTDDIEGERDPVSETEDALLYLRTLFPVGAFDTSPRHRLPPIVLKHQLYALIPDRTMVDRQLQSLIDGGRVRQFKLGVSENDYAVILSDDYRGYLTSWMGESTALCKRLTHNVLSSCKDVSISRDKLSKELKMSREDISTLVNGGILLVRDVGKNNTSWWFAIPGVSPFIKSLTKGRDMVQQILKKSKYKELLRKELLGRKLTVTKLPMEFHIHDIIGADIVECIETTSGVLLRLIESHPQRHNVH